VTSIGGTQGVGATGSFPNACLVLARSSQLQENKLSEPAAINSVAKTAKAAATRCKEPGLIKRLAAGAVICAEGYVFELERRGYLQAGAFVPRRPQRASEVVEQLHMDFVRAGSDVTQALTYYVHREKLRVIGREKDLVPMNRNGGSRLPRKSPGVRTHCSPVTSAIPTSTIRLTARRSRRSRDLRGAGWLGRGRWRRLHRGGDFRLGRRGADGARGHQEVFKVPAVVTFLGSPGKRICGKVGPRQRRVGGSR